MAHSLVRLLGVSSPQELEPYGLTSAGDLVDLISRVSLPPATSGPVLRARLVYVDGYSSPRIRSPSPIPA